MSVERDKMIAALKEHVIPVLRERGFKGSFPHFRRLSRRFIHILSFQFSSWGGGFVVEAAACPDTGITLLDGRHFMCHGLHDLAMHLLSPTRTAQTP